MQAFVGVIIIVISLLYTPSISAQKTEMKNNDVSLIYGIKPFSWRNIFDNSTSIGIFSLQYMRQTARWLGVGAMIGYQHFGKKNEFDQSGDDFTAMAMLRVSWINKPNFVLYSKAGIGATWGNYNSDGNTGAALQLPLIGASFNLGKGFFGLAELGFGSLGFLMLGGGYCF